MKKFLSIILTLVMVAALSACGAESTPEAAAPAAPAAEADNAAAPASGDELYFDYRGTVIAVHAEAAPILAVLGEPMSCTEQPSCAFQGLDRSYYFGSFYLETYEKDGAEYVSGFWFADDTVQTPEGIYIGSTQAEVEQAYGADAFNGTNAYSLRRGDSKLTVILTDGAVSSIQYTYASM